MLLGPTPVTVSEILTAVVANFLSGAPKSAQTSSIKHALEKLGKSLGFTVFSTDRKHQHDNHEWLLDLSWWEPGRGTVLACECEWGNAGEIVHDFEKLLAIKAPLKLMIFCSRRAGAEREDVLLRTDIDAILQAVGTALLDFNQHVAGETYVLLEHVESNSTFRAYEFRAPKDGKLEISIHKLKELFRRIEIERASAA